MNIDRMPAGPELDRLIAERVMVNNLRADGSSTTIGVIAPGEWSPSTNIAHAWEVVAKMRTDPKNDWFTINWYGDSPEWYAGFGDGCRQTPGNGETAPLAICRAALKAVM